MVPELHLEIVYENNLDTDKFARMFNNKAQSYKFYWFEAILNLVKTEETAGNRRQSIQGGAGRENTYSGMAAEKLQ